MRRCTCAGDDGEKHAIPTDTKLVLYWLSASVHPGIPPGVGLETPWQGDPPVNRTTDRQM